MNGESAGREEKLLRNTTLIIMFFIWKSSTDAIVFGVLEGT